MLGCDAAFCGNGGKSAVFGLRHRRKSVHYYHAGQLAALSAYVNSVATSDEMDINIAAQGVYIVRSGENTIKVAFIN